MPKLIKLDGESARWAEDEFVFVPDEEPIPAARAGVARPTSSGTTRVSRARWRTGSTCTYPSAQLRSGP